MRWLNDALGALVGGLLFPFRGLPPIVGLAFVALLTSVAILLVYRVASDQKALRRAKDRIVAGILEIRLFRDDLRTIGRAQLDIVRHSLTYMRLSLVPMLWVIVPVLLLMIQLQFRYGYAPLRPGESAIVTASLSEGAVPARLGTLTLESVPGVDVATPTLLIPAAHEADWRIEVREGGSHELRVRVGNEVVTKALAAAPAVEGRSSATPARVSPRRPSAGWMDQLLYPVEPPVAAGGTVTAIEVAQPAATVSLLGWHMHWMVAFFLLTILFAFALQKPLKVTI